MKMNLKSLIPTFTVCLGATPLLAQSAADASTSHPITPAHEERAPLPDDPNDRQIADAVDDELLSDSAVAASRVDSVCSKGIVTLTGSLDSLLGKERAGRVAMAVRGVRGVVNRIDVRSGDRSDDAIRNDVVEALLLDAATESYEIDVRSNDGNVKLEGKVDSYAERRLAERVAKGVRGVRSIDNAIEVDYAVARVDSEIEKDIEGTLRWDRFVDDALVNVAVEDGNVKLTGVVGSVSEKSEAETCAWVAGVRSVDADGVAVERWLRDDDLRGDKYVPKTDAEIRKAVNDALLHDPRVFSFEIAPECAAGVVTLRGTVDNVKAKRAAEQDAEHVVGVWQVENRIKVRPNRSIDDETIATNIERALARDPWVQSFHVTVTVDDGDVHLYGTVDDPFDKARADDLAARVAGVVDVDNLLVVNDDSAYLYDPYVDYWYSPNHFTWYGYHTPYVTMTSDREIRAEIRDELWWSPFVDADEVTVRVDDGCATLTGTVDSVSEAMAATENAYEGGAVRVVNLLDVGGSSQ